MDGDCSCGKRRGKCDGNCSKTMKDGGMYKKPMMDRGDALTPQEYLAACDLGIQGQPRSYIRARLDYAERLDLKCGKGSISEGEKCTKGPATRSEKKRGGTARTVGHALAVGGGVGAVAGLAAAARGRGIKTALFNRAKAGILNTASSAAGRGAAANIVGKAAFSRGKRMGRVVARKAQRLKRKGVNKATSAYLNSPVIPSIAEGSRVLNNTASRVGRGIQGAARTGDNTMRIYKQMGKRSKQRSMGMQYSGRTRMNSDSVWADGFAYDHTAL
jgi:hypothetical protein